MIHIKNHFMTRIPFVGSGSRWILSAVILVSVLVASSHSALGASVKIGEFTYNYNVVNNRAVLVDNSLKAAVSPAPTGHFVIPDMLGGYPVGTIGDNAFTGCSNMTGVTIPDTVTSIGNSAFYNCSKLEKIGLPAGVTAIGSSAFSGCSGLVEFEVPAGVTALANNLLRDCVSLVRIEIPHGVTSIGTFAFLNCASLRSITIPASVSSIQTRALSDCSQLREVFFRGNTPAIGSPGSLYNNSPLVKNYVVAGSMGWDGNSSSTILPSLWNGRPIEALSQYSSGGYTYTYVTDNGKARIIAGPGVSAIEPKPVGVIALPQSFGNVEIESFGESAFADCTDMTGISIPTTVKNIGDYAFTGCHGLKTVIMPPSVTHVGKSAFEDCPVLESLAISENAASIGPRAFASCTNLVEITIPAGVKSIAAGAFAGCNALVQITIREGVTDIGDGVFADCAALPVIRLPESLSDIGDNVFEGCAMLDEVRFQGDAPNAGAQIYGGVPQGMITLVLPYSKGWDGDPASPYLPEPAVWKGMPIAMALETEVLGDGYTYTFSIIRGGAHIVSGTDFVPAIFPLPSSGTVTIPETLGGFPVVAIGDYAFYNCADMEGIVIPAGVEQIGKWAFFGCSGLTRLTLPPTLVSVVDYAFYYCYGLESVTIAGDSVYIGDNAFSLCAGLREVVFLGDAPVPGSSPNGLFAGAHQDLVVYIQAGTKGWDGDPASDNWPPNGMWLGFPVAQYVGPTDPPDDPDAVLTALYDGHTYSYKKVQGGIRLDSGSAYVRAVAPEPAGVFAIPAALDGQPVVEIGKFAFFDCWHLAEIIIPENVVLIDDMAFECCSVLENVVLPDSLVRIGNRVFRHCLSLREIVIPENVASLGDYVFDWNVSLRDVGFAGDAPVVNAAIYNGTPPDLQTSVFPDTAGWDGDPNSTALPPSGLWLGRPITHIKNTPPKLMTNTDVPVPHCWIKKHFPNANVDDYDTIADDNGANDIPVWQSYVADLNPNDKNSKFMTHIGFQNGVLDVWCTPVSPKRNYRIVSTTNLADPVWIDWDGEYDDAVRFFKMKVEVH